MSSHGTSWKLPLSSVPALSILSATASAQAGHVLNGVGAVNQSMAGASIASLGAAYIGFEKWVLAADLRHIDYQNTDGFRVGF